MWVKEADVKAEYDKNADLRKEDIKSLQEWAVKQPHFPPVSELQLILFLHSCHFSVETAKSTMDIFFTVRTHCPEFFAKRNPLLPESKRMLNTTIAVPLPKHTKENYQILYSRVIDADPNAYVFAEALKNFDMNLMLYLAQEGTAEGLVIIIDFDNVSFAHVVKLGMMTAKKYLYYLQEALPVRLKSMHFINIVPFIDKVLAIVKPFMKKELLDVLHLHKRETIETLYEFVPQECLPKEMGGTADSFSMIHDNSIEKLTANAKYFDDEEKQIINESKRPGKPKDAGDLFGVEGNFKKLDID